MRLTSKLLAGAALAGTVALVSAPAYAVTFAITPGPFFFPGNPSGVIPSGVVAEGSNTYDFTFTTIGGTYKTLMQMQNSAVSNGQALPLTFNLFRGAPGTGTLVSGSAGTPTAATLELSLTSGNYYLELTTSNAPKELVTGGITLLSAVPEPAAWATMILGFGLLGLAARRRRGVVALGA